MRGAKTAYRFEEMTVKEAPEEVAPVQLNVGMERGLYDCCIAR